MANADKTLKNKDQLDIYPITRERNVYDENNVNLKAKFENVVFNDNDVHKFAQELYEESANELYIPDQNITKNGITVNVTNGVITANGTATANTDIILTDSLNIGVGQYSVNFFETLPIVSGVYCNLRYLLGSAVGYGSSTKTVTTTNTITNINFYVTSGVVLNNFKISPMLVKGDVVPKIFGKYNPNRHITNGEAEFLKEEHNKSVNQLDIPDMPSFTQKGITCSVSNGKITISGVATDNWNLGDYYSYIFTIGTYSYSLFNNEINNNIQIGFKQSSTQYYVRLDEVNKIVENVTTTDNSFFNIRIPTGTTISNLILTPIVVSGDKASDIFATYNSSSHITNPQADLLKNEYEKSLNLFNSKNKKTGFLNKDNGVVYPSNVKWEYNEDYIKAQPNTTYTLSWVGGTFYQANICYYDASKNFVSGTNLEKSNTTQMSFTTPNNASYIRVSYAISNNIDGDITRTNIMLNKGPEALPYQPYNGPIIHEKDIEPVLLWKNGNVDIGYNATTDNVIQNLSEYIKVGQKFRMVYKEYYGETYAGQYLDFEVIKDTYALSVAIASDVFKRGIIMRKATNTLEIGDAKTSDNIVNNNQIIPCALYLLP